MKLKIMKLTYFCLAFCSAFEDPVIFSPEWGCGGWERVGLQRGGQVPGSSAMVQSPWRWGCSCLHGDRPAILPELCQEGGKIDPHFIDEERAFSASHSWQVGGGESNPRSLARRPSPHPTSASLVGTRQGPWGLSAGRQPAQSVTIKHTLAARWER